MVEITKSSPPPLAGWYRGHRVYADAEPRPGRVVYVCKVRLVGTSPTTGKTFAVDHPQHIKETNVRYVHVDNLEGAA